MNSLNIQQGSTVEYVSTDLIKKLYDVAISVSEPLEGELDLAYLSGYISVGKSYELYVKYLAGTVFYKNTGSIHNNPSGRFLNLRIDVTEDYYIPFEDSAVESVLKTNNISSDGIGITHTDAAAVTAFNTMFKNNTDITSFDELLYFTNYTTVGLAGSPPYGTGGEFSGCSSLESIDLRNVDWIDGKFYGSTSLREVKNFNGRGIISYLAYGNQFGGCTALESINLSNCMLIGLLAFDSCSSLRSIGNLNNLIYAERGAFIKCANLQIDVNMPRLHTVAVTNNPIGVFRNEDLNEWNNNKYIPGYMFTSSGITSISNLGKSEKISDGSNYAYLIYNAGFASNCPNLTTVKLPKEMTYIGSYAFYGCPNLTSVKQYVDSIDDWVEGETPAVGNLTGVTTFGGYCFTNCPNLTLTTADIANATTLLTYAFKQSPISGVLNCPSLTSLGAGAFLQCGGLTGVTGLGSITGIPNSCFSGCSGLTSVTLPSNCTSIDNSAFGGCTSLTSINLSNITTLGNSAFLNCSGLTSIDLSNVLSIDNGAFRNSGLTSVTIPDSAVALAILVFVNCTRLTTVTIGNNVPAIQGETFYGCSSLRTVNIGNSVIAINGANTFRDCGQLTTVNLPEGLTTIGGGWMFRGCNNLTAIHLPSTLTSIGETAFALCGLTSITIPAAVTSIGNNCFGQDGNNTSFMSITFEGTTPPTVSGNDGLGGIWSWQAQNPTASPGRKIYVPYGCKSAYVADSYFSTLANIIEELPQS